MPNRSRLRSRRLKTRPLRQSVTIPASLAVAVRRLAKERHLTMNQALIVLAERGIRAESDANENLQASYEKFMREKDPARKNEAGKDLIRVIFGMNAIAEDSVL